MTKRGQSIIEYCLILVLVILGIVYMGPYVLRSVNAHFKLWDDSVHDSFSENITQAPVSAVPFINLACNCHDVDDGCTPLSSSAKCGTNQRTIEHVCNPSLCDSTPEAYCVTDNSCCSIYYQQGCGTIPIPSPAATAINSNLTITISNGSNSTVPLNGCLTYDPTQYPATANNCYYGQSIYATACTDTSIACHPDANCAPQCEGVGSPGVMPCTRTTPPGFKLDQNYGLTYVNNSSCSTDNPECACTNPPPPCQVFCDSSQGYWLNASGTGCTNIFEAAPYILSPGEAPLSSKAPAGGGPSPLEAACPHLCNCSSELTPCTGSYDLCIKFTIDCSMNDIVNPSICPKKSSSGITTGDLTSATMTDVSSPMTYPYCDQLVKNGLHHGHPSEECQINFIYSPKY